MVFSPVKTVGPLLLAAGIPAVGSLGAVSGVWALLDPALHRGLVSWERGKTSSIHPVVSQKCLSREGLLEKAAFLIVFAAVGW